MADERPETADIDAVGNSEFIGKALVRRTALRRPERVTDIVVGSNVEAGKACRPRHPPFSQKVLYIIEKTSA
jgi:hypothetical protein